MNTSYLGKLTNRGLKTTYFWDLDAKVVVQATACEGRTTVQAFKRLALVDGRPKKGIQLEQLTTILGAYNSSLEVSTSSPDEDFVRKLEPLRGSKRGVLESALERTEKELADAENDYFEFRGAKDLDEAHENLKNRNYELRDINQKAYHNTLEPQFIYHPGHPLRTQLSAFQTVHRWHLQDLRDRTKERASAIRQRITFSMRSKIQDLKAKRKEILDELGDEHKREKDHGKSVATLAHENSSVKLLLTIRSQSIVVEGRKNHVVAAVAQEVADVSIRLRKTLKDRFGLVFADASPDTALISSLTNTGTALVKSEELNAEVAAVAGKLIGDRPAPPRLPQVRFPRFREGKRLAYLGLALREDLTGTNFPILFDLDAQGVRHTIACGASGSGKSFAASLIVEGALRHEIPVLVFDPTRSWTGFAEPCSSASQLDAYERFGLDRGWARAYETTIVDPDADDHQALDGVTGAKGITVVTPSKLTESQELNLFGAWLKGLHRRVQAMPESSRLVLLVVIEEAHRFKGKPEVEELLELFARTARVRGVGLLLCTQVLTDLSPGIRSNAGTHLLLKTSYTQDLTRAGQIAGKEIQRILPRLERGKGVVHFPDYGAPALVAFRPPLHSQAAIPESVAAMAQNLQALGKVTVALTRHVATSDTTRSDSVASVENVTEPASEGEKTRSETSAATTWRDVATRFNGSGVSASAILRGIKDRGLTTPSVRTIQRFMASWRHHDAKFNDKSSRLLKS